MLKLCFKLRDIHFGKLMELYAEGNEENAMSFYPNDEKTVGIMKAEQDFYQYLRQIFFRSEGAFYAIWEENAEYVSALRLEPYRDALLLEALETHPAYRSRGYAKKLITSVLEHLEQKGCKTVYSHVHKGNVPSIQTHLACNFHRISEQATCIDGSVTFDSCTMAYSFGSPEV